VPCKHCQEVDHSDAECAVAAILPKPLPPPASSLSPQRADRSTMGKGKRLAPYSRQRPVCTSWNTGNCRFRLRELLWSPPRGGLPGPHLPSGHAHQPRKVRYRASSKTARPHYFVA
jgi:hypothetical protein